MAHPRTGRRPFAVAVAMLALCSCVRQPAESVARAWLRNLRDAGAVEQLVRASMEAGGQTVFRTVLDVARDTERPARMRLGALEVLAAYVNPHAVFELPPDSSRLSGSVDHPPFNWHATYEPFAPDTVMAVLQALASSAEDPVVSRSAAHVRRRLQYTFVSPGFIAAETARRNGVAARAAGCWAIRYDRTAGPAWAAALAGTSDTFALRDEEHLNRFGRARVLVGRTPRVDGAWDELGPDSVLIYPPLDSGSARIVFPLGGTRATVTTHSDSTTRLGANVQRVECPADLRR